MCVCIHTGVGHIDNESAQHFDSGGKTRTNLFLGSGRDSNLWPLDLESDALPIEPPHHPWDRTQRVFGSYAEVSLAFKKTFFFTCDHDG